MLLASRHCRFSSPVIQAQTILQHGGLSKNFQCPAYRNDGACQQKRWSLPDLPAGG